MGSPARYIFACAFALLLSSAGCVDIECATDEDCPGMSVCVGSIPCPHGLVCDGPAEPGVCRPGERIMCLGSGGSWDVGSCGHYRCGEFPECDAVVPGCDCGSEANFDKLRGCMADVACRLPCRDDLDCEAPLSCIDGGCRDESEWLCTTSGGGWDPLACGHYQCGWPQECAAVIPGCDCGPMETFDPGVGCRPDAQCPAVCGNEVCPPGWGCDVCPSICDDPERPCLDVCGPAVCVPLPERIPPPILEAVPDR